ncbi:MAG: ZIP family metal transporter [Firmicutes bacterium]|nr:ZIP family metal transporter [Bacillota bacterium]
MHSRVTFWVSFLLPVLLLGMLLVWFWHSTGGLRFEAPAPIEAVTYERVVFLPASGATPERIIAHIRNVGPEPVTIAHVQVGWFSRASWNFSIEPSPTLPRMGAARVVIPYPWTEGEPYEIVLFSANGIPFVHEVAIATATPQWSARSFWQFAMLGIYVGVLPVFLGILWLPFLRQLGQRAYGFLLSLTIGLLVFIGVDALADALREAEHLPGPYQGVAVIVLGVALSLLGLYALSRAIEARQQARGGEISLTIAYLVAFGIGIHNLGEGLAIGGAYALGEVATGALLIIGFMIHNLTEGIAIVAPIARSEFGAGRWRHLIWLGLLAGLPTILGTSMGAFSPSPLLAVLFVALGAGAVFQVVLEIMTQMRREHSMVFAQPANVSGFLLGLVVMYVTGLMIIV